VLRLGAALGHHATHGLGDLVEFLDLTIGDPAFFKAFSSESLENILTRSALPQLHQLDAG
jgi:hypothetical protein